MLQKLCTILLYWKAGALHDRLRDDKVYIIWSNASVAQWIEHLTSDQRVEGSNPSRRALFKVSKKFKNSLTIAKLGWWLS